MKLEIESVANGYLITIPAGEYGEVEKKFVVEEKETMTSDSVKDEYQAFHELVTHLQDFFGVSNSKHKCIGYVNGLCSEHIRWDIHETMEKSLKNPKNDTGD